MPRLDAASTPGAVHDLSWGIERETHRVQASGALSRRPHPTGLQPPAFTRDFGETQLEIVTPPRNSVDLALASLERLTEEARRAVAPELLWPFSMPPRLPDEAAIEIADFGATDRARRARLYRVGLALRYGKARQMICGVHVNVSFRRSLEAAVVREAPPTREEGGGGRESDALYLRLARNLYQDLPLLVLLTGATPVRGGGSLEPGPSAISHRNGANGYARGEFQPYLSLESLGAYLAGIRRGLRTESSAFSGLGLVRAGRVVQLNANVFQTEKEFYAPIRLRQSLLAGETTLAALEKRGIGYLELRFVDVDPFTPSGVAAETLRLLHLFVLDGLHRLSLPRSGAALTSDLRSTALAALRDPATLTEADPLLVSARQRLEGLAPWAERLDTGAAGVYADCLSVLRRRLERPETHPSAVLARTLAESGTDWTRFGVEIARAHAHLGIPATQGARHALDDARV